MKIVFLGNHSVEYSSETHHKKSLELLGHEVVALQETQAGSEQILNEASESDMFVWVHTHGWQTPGQITMARVLKELKQKGIPTVTYHLDLWLGLARQKDLDKDPVYHYIQHFFTCDKQMAAWFNGNTEVKGHYLPAGVFQDDMALMNLPKKYDVIFVGSRGYHPEWPYRSELIDWLEKTYGERFHRFGGDSPNGIRRGADLTRLYNETKVVVGDSLVKNFDYPYYWSDRLYETAGRGGFQIFPEIKGIQNEYDTYDGFRDIKDIELVTYEFDHFETLKELIDFWLEHDEERETVRTNAYERTRRDHTYANRWQTILDTIKSGK